MEKLSNLPQPVRIRDLAYISESLSEAIMKYIGLLYDAIMVTNMIVHCCNL